MFVQCALQTDRIIAKYLAHSITQLHKQSSLTSHWPRCRQARMMASSCSTIASRLQVTWNWAECYKHRTARRDNTPADNVTAVSGVFIYILLSRLFERITSSQTHVGNITEVAAAAAKSEHLGHEDLLLLPDGDDPDHAPHRNAPRPHAPHSARSLHCSVGQKK